MKKLPLDTLSREPGAVVGKLDAGVIPEHISMATAIRTVESLIKKQENHGKPEKTGVVRIPATIQD